MVIFSILVYNYLIGRYGHIDVWWQLDFAGTMQCAVPRAMAGIFGGLFLRYVYERMQECNCMQSKKSKLLASCFAWGMVVTSIMLALFMPHTKYDFMHIVLLGAIIITLSFGSQIQVGSVERKITAISMPMYIWQLVSIKVVTLTGTQTFSRLALVIVLDFVICLLWVRFEKHIIKLL